MKLCFLDLETYWNTAEGYGLRSLSMVEYVRDPRFKVHGIGVAFGDEAPRWYSGEAMRRLLLDTDWSPYWIVAHNAKFDGFILAEGYRVRPAGWIDTLGMANAAIGKLAPGGSLAALAEYFQLPTRKGEMRTDGILTLTPTQEKELADYCLNDVDLCRQIYKRMAPDFPENQYRHLDWTVRAFIEPVLRLNTELLLKTTESEAVRKADLVAKMAKGEKGIYSSNDKFAALLEAEGYPAPQKWSAKQLKHIPALAMGDEGFLDMLYSENPHLRQLCETRAAVKSTLLETRAKKMAAVGATGAWPFDVKFSGAKQTHRLSGGPGAGGNPQNLTRGSALRRAVEAPEGYSLVVGDFAAVECRLVAYLANDPGLIQALDGDPYCDFATAFYGRKITKADETERRFGKEAILGLGYGMGAKKFRVRVRIRTGLKITEQESQSAVNLYRSKYYRVPELWEMLNEMIPVLAGESPEQRGPGGTLFKRGAIVLPDGLLIRFPNLRRVYTERGSDWVYETWGKTKSHMEIEKLYGGKITENIAQGLAGVLCKSAGAAFFSQLTGTVHDEIHLVAPKDEAAGVAARLKAVMETAPLWLPEMQLKAEVGFGPNWAEAK